MADLQSRVGRRFFPNQSWIKPGYEPPKRSLLNRSSQESEGEPELYSLGASPGAATSCLMRSSNAAGSSSNSRHSSPSTRPYVPLLDRIQMEPDGDCATDMDAGDENKQAKSLLDRVECPLDGATSSTPAVRDPPAGLAHTDTKDNSDGDSGTDSLSTFPKHPALIGQTACSTSESEHPVISCGQLKGQHNALLSRGIDLTGEHGKGGPSSNGAGHSRSRSLAATSPPPSRRPSSSKDDNSSTSGRGDRRSPSNQPISRGSTSSSMTTEEFLNHILPLAQRIAQDRAGDTEAGNSTNAAAAEVNSIVVTQEAVEEFNKKLLNLRNDWEHHCDELKKDEMMADDSRDANKNRTQDTVLISTRSPHPVSPPIQPPQVETSPEVELSARLSNHEIPIPIPIPEGATKTDSSPVTPPSSYNRTRGTFSYSESRYHNRKTYSRERRRSGDYNGRKDWYHDDDVYQRSSKGRRRSVSPYRRPYTSPKRTRRDSYSYMDYSPRYRRRSRSRGRVRDRSRSRSPHRSRERRGKHHHRTDRSYRGSDSGRSERPAPASVSSTSATQRPTVNNPQNESHKEVTASSAKSAGPLPPCHNVPGLWFAQQGLHQLGISIVEFEIDEVTATKWNIRSEGETRTNGTNSDTGATPQLSLELCCLAFCDVQTTLQKLEKDVTSHELVQALSILKRTWPPQGNFIVAINPESKGGKLWLPNVLSQTESLQLGQYVHKGNNIVKFIQLSDLSEHIFVLLATAVENNGFRDDFSKLKFLFPEESTGIKFQAPTLLVDRK